MKKPFRIIGLLLILALFGYAGLKISKTGKTGGGRTAKPPAVKVENPRVEEVTHTLNFTGDILPNRQVSIYSKVTGALDAIYVEVGDAVRSGQVLARLDTTELAQQALQTAATYQNAKAVFSRAQTLSGGNMLSKQEFDNAEAALAVAKAAFESARLRVDYATITAPFGGVITKRLLDAGALVNANTGILFNLMDQSKVKVRIEVSEKETPLILQGVKAFVSIDAYPGELFEGEVTRRSEAIDLSTRTMSVEVEVPNNDRRLKPGMYAAVSILLERRPNALTVPSNTIQKDDAGYFIWVVANGVSAKQRIEVGVEQGLRTEVKSGLAVSDSIITLGIQSLREGGAVLVSGAGGGSGEGKKPGGREKKQEGR